MPGEKILKVTKFSKAMAFLFKSPIYCKMCGILPCEKIIKNTKLSIKGQKFQLKILMFCEISGLLAGFFSVLVCGLATEEVYGKRYDIF